MANMEGKLDTKRKKSTAQETFQHLREQTKIELEEKNKKFKDAHDKFVAEKTRKKAKEEETDSPQKEESKHIKDHPITPAKDKKKVDIHEISEHQFPHTEPSHNKLPIPKSEHCDGHQINLELLQTRHHNRKRNIRCTNCCGGLPGQGPAKPRHECGSQSCCNSENRLRGGSDDRRSTRRNLPKIFEYRSSSVPSDEFEFQMSSLRSRDSNYLSSKSAKLEHKDSTSDSFPMYNVERSRGGCGGCGGPPQPCYRTTYQRDCAKLINHPCSPPPCSPQPCSPQPCSTQPCSTQPCSPPPCSLPPCCQPCPLPPLPACQRPPALCAKTSSTNTKGCCPCGGCGGPACSDNPSGGGNDAAGGSGGCCGGSRLQGLPCKCKCQSCSTSPPAGGCGGQSCGRIYSCAGSSGGRCCFPRNTKRRSGADCCGGSDPNCGGCC